MKRLYLLPLEMFAVLTSFVVLAHFFIILYITCREIKNKIYNSLLRYAYYMSMISINVSNRRISKHFHRESV